MKTILVTGGAGYIGSHVTRQLRARGERVVVLDNLSTGFRSAVLDTPLVVGDTGDREGVAALLREHSIGTVLHFAAHTIVPESVADPLKYYRNNTCATRTLLECWESLTKPINPYGSSKLMSEWMLRDLAAATGLRHVTLRYFNVAGSDPGGTMGHSQPEATLLVKVACQAAVGVRPGVAVFGTDYPTPDGTGVRDYIHVEDLADAHLRAVDYLRAGGASTTLNCGYGHGYTVREVLRTVEQVHGRPLRVTEQPRRAGDPPTLVARADRIRQVLGWRPRHDDLETIVATQLAWERALLERPELCRN